MPGIGKLIQRLRNQRGWSTRDLAEKISVSRSYISRIENENRRLNTEILGKLAAAFKVDVTYLTGGEDVKGELVEARRRLKAVSDAMLRNRRLKPSFVEKFVEKTFNDVFPDAPQLKTIADWDAGMGKDALISGADSLDEKLLVQQLADNLPRMRDELLDLNRRMSYPEFRARKKEEIAAWSWEEKKAFVESMMPEILVHYRYYREVVGEEPFEGEAGRVEAGKVGEGPLGDMGKKLGILDFFRDLSGRNIVAFRIRDNSMSPRYNEGDVVFCEAGRAPLEGDRVMAKAKGTDQACRIYYPHGKFVQLVAENPRTPPVFCRSDDLEWVYPVVKSISD